MSKYFVLNATIEKPYCGIYDLPDDLPENYRAARGEPWGNSYIDGTAFRMADEVPGINIADVINNACNYLMISERMKNWLKESASGEIEYLRFTLLNHKNRVASEQCYIANVLNFVDCADPDKTIGDKDHLNAGWYAFIERLYLDEKKIPADQNIFRLKTFPKLILVREDLKDFLMSKGITGAEFLSLDKDIDFGD